MKVLKTILIIIYPILVILLLLPNLKSCNESRTNNLGDQIEEPINTAEVVKHAEMIGQSGTLKVTLLWNFQGDIDLHVKQPNGKEIYYNEKEDVSNILFSGYLSYLKCFVYELKLSACNVCSLRSFFTINNVKLY